jgi:hypothetical protein
METNTNAAELVTLCFTGTAHAPTLELYPAAKVPAGAWTLGEFSSRPNARKWAAAQRFKANPVEWTLTPARMERARFVPSVLVKA